MVYKWSVLVCVLAVSAGLAMGSQRRHSQIPIPEFVDNIDTSAGSPTPEQLKLLQRISAKVDATCVEQYPMIVRTIGAEHNYQPPKVTITFTYGYDGVAGTSNDHTDISAKYALAHPDDIPGVMVHELTHVVQHYTHDSPGWLVEGIADYVRWYNYEPPSKRHPVRLSRADARGSYQTTAAFLNWAVQKYDRNLVKKLNQALYDGTYTEDIWKQITGKTLDDLNAEWKASLGTE